MNNTARLNGGCTVEKRFYDFVYGDTTIQKEKTGDEIVNEVFEKLGLEVDSN